MFHLSALTPGATLRFFTTLLLSAFLFACSDNDNNRPEPVAEEPVAPPPSGPGSIVEVASEAGSFETLIAALQATGLDATLADENGTFTVFAPTDAAFDLLGQETIDALLADTDTLSDILLYHVLGEQAVDAETATSLAGSTVETANGDIIALTLRDGNLFINESRVTDIDIEASNGIIHVIDAVLSPPAPIESGVSIVETAVADGRFGTLVTALQAAGLDTALADPDATFTVFAPTDDAFALLGEPLINELLADIPRLTDILLYHVVNGAAVDSITATSLLGQLVEMFNSTATEPGDTVLIDIREGELFVNDSRVIVKDIVTTNGIIHAIDAVLLPPSPELGTITEVAAANGSFTTLVAALEATDLDTVLADESSTFTVFAPTDDAFALLGEDTINALLADPERLSNILLYHVLSDQAVDAATALTLDGSDVAMTNGDTVTITVDGDNLLVNDSVVIIRDVPASNGIIHAIDAVLLPPAETLGSIVDVAVANGSFTTLVAALEATELDVVLADETATFTVFAPTDDAFALLGEDTINALLADTETLSDILLYHVLPEQAVDAATAITLDGSEVQMANGDSVTITVNGENLLINASTVIIRDVQASNGIIHVIDVVLTPPA